jgi:hypothetical protein
MTRTLCAAVIGLALADVSTSPVAAQTAPEPLLSERIASGVSFVVVTKDRSVPLREGSWSYPDGADRWTVFEGRYNPESGIWDTDVVGFQVRGIEYHSCPPDLDHSRFGCGGVHTFGHRLSRRVTPRDHVLIVLENELTFDEAGNVYREGELIGMVATPPSPY